MKKFLSLILFLAFALTVLPDPAQAEAPTDIMEVYNCSEYVSLREKPDTKSSVIKKVYKGDLVYFYAKAAADFYLVGFDGKEGYILAKYLKGTDFYGNSVLLPNQQIYNCSEWVSLRKEDNARSERLAKVPLGAVVTRCIGGNGAWIYCSYKGKSGYIKTDYLRTADYDKIKREEEERKRREEEEAAKNYPKTPFDCMQVVNATSWVSLRKEPGADSKRLCEIPVYDYVTDCLYVNADWVHVYYNGMNGYVNAKYLTPATLPEPEEEENFGKGFDLLPGLPSYDAFMAVGTLVCEATCGNYHVIARRAYSQTYDREELLAVCYDAANKPLWNAYEEADGIAQVDATDAFIGGTALNPYLVTFRSAGKGFTARAIDGKGTLLWQNDCQNKGTAHENACPGGGLTAVVDENGTIYAVGYFDDAPIAIDVNGNLLWRGIGPDSMDIYWPYLIEPQESGILVYYDSCVYDEGDMAYVVLYSREDGSCILSSKVSMDTAEEDEILG